MCPPLPYNGAVPTPFNHLALAEAVRLDPRLLATTRRSLDRSRPAFLLGHTAPDYVNLAGRPRAESHLFEVPMADRRPAHQILFGRHPELADARGLDPDQAAFLAGYIAHLWIDQAWIAFIFEPIFGPSVSRGTFDERLLDHNLMRAALDQEDLTRLPSDLGAILQQAEPRRWLPFAADDSLCRWRDNLASQLRPGGRPSTMEVFASRHGIEPRAFAARLSALEAGPVHPGRLKAFRRLAGDRALALTEAYLEGRLEDLEFIHTPFPRLHSGRRLEANRR